VVQVPILLISIPARVTKLGYFSAVG
jgi:hypothetical protein